VAVDEEIKEAREMGAEYDAKKDWRETMQEQDAIVNEKHDAYDKALEQGGDNSREVDSARQEWRDAMDNRAEVLNEMEKNANDRVESLSEGHRDAYQKYGKDSKETEEAYEKVEQARREQDELKRDMQIEKERKM
jgi:hypothetical protein